MAANFHELKHSKTKRSAKQRTAIVLSEARKSAVKAGKPEKGPGPPPKKSKAKSRKKK
jgi:hypothetical protein